MGSSNGKARIRRTNEQSRPNEGEVGEGAAGRRQVTWCKTTIWQRYRAMLGDDDVDMYVGNDVHALHAHRANFVSQEM